jgi:hypothetical protein
MAYVGVAVNPRGAREWAALAIGAGALVAALLYHFIFIAREEKGAGKGLEPIG